MWASGKVKRDLLTLFNNPQHPHSPISRCPISILSVFLILFQEYESSSASTVRNIFISLHSLKRTDFKYRD